MLFMIAVIFALLGFFCGLVFCTICYYNGAVQVNLMEGETHFTLQVIDEDKLFKQQFILLKMNKNAK